MGLDSFVCLFCLISVAVVLFVFRDWVSLCGSGSKDKVGLGLTEFHLLLSELRPVPPPPSRDGS